MASYVITCCSTADLSKEHFEKRNIHFYVNKCGFQIDEFWCEHFKSSHPMPDDEEHDPNEGPDEMFHFVKRMK